MTQKPVLICIQGPTAVGKTAISIELAKRLGAEIISSDSRQMYKNISIGTAKPNSEELASVPHHFVDFLELDELYSAGQFEREALSLIKESDKPYWILVGGSGLYSKALLEGLDELPKDHSLRQELNKRRSVEGLEVLQAELRSLDPDHFAATDIQNPQRVIRALEVCLITGKTYSSLRNAEEKERPFTALQIALRREKSELDKRIRERCRLMLLEGWMDEARSVHHLKHLNALNTVGYKSLFKM
ncbi:MAG: tRNA (adenosine(37)-N6)-dimethylallyltransferase MiaA, partial [Bacteroidetes bacterium]|nr:tRNA (adenosine(37)-N6)-dimethylallyltransferase MiaA [Bacteroidota bacterium]